MIKKYAAVVVTLFSMSLAHSAESLDIDKKGTYSGASSEKVPCSLEVRKIKKTLIFRNVKRIEAEITLGNRTYAGINFQCNNNFEEGVYCYSTLAGIGTFTLRPRGYNQDNLPYILLSSSDAGKTLSECYDLKRD